MSVMKRILSVHAQRYPLMEPWDYVKLLYQSEFGPGHLVEEGDVLPGLQAEFIMAKGIGYAPPYLSEAIGGGLCRFHLDPHRLSPEDLPLLARCFALSARPRGSRTSGGSPSSFARAATSRPVIPPYRPRSRRTAAPRKARHTRR